MNTVFTAHHSYIVAGIWDSYVQRADARAVTHEKSVGGGTQICRKSEKSFEKLWNDEALQIQWCWPPLNLFFFFGCNEAEKNIHTNLDTNNYFRKFSNETKRRMKAK